VKPNINSVEVHPQLRNNGHPVDGVLVGAGRQSEDFGSRDFNFNFNLILKII
jgi:hypothetical protein